jgi:cobalt/nickel transport system ATP-binding protein
MTASVLFQFDGVSCRYPDGTSGVTDCSLTIERGSRTVVMGVNGAGKTTFLQLLNGILRPCCGMIRFNGQPVDYSRAGLYRLRAQVGLLFQNPDSQLLSASVEEDVSFGPINLGYDTAVVRSSVAAALQTVGMTDCADRPVQALSYGQKKRIGIAGLLAMQPEVLVLDEPMAGLDQPMQTGLELLLDTLQRQGMTIVIATHDSDFAYRWSDRMLLFAEGRCRRQLQTDHLAGSLPLLNELGLGAPSVLSLYHALLEQQLIPQPATPPRTVADLIRQVAANPRSV